MTNRRKRGGGERKQEEDEELNIQVQAIQAMPVEERPTKKAEIGPTKTAQKSVQNSKKSERNKK